MSEKVQDRCIPARGERGWVRRGRATPRGLPACVQGCKDGIQNLVITWEYRREELATWRLGSGPATELF